MYFTPTPTLLWPLYTHPALPSAIHRGVIIITIWRAEITDDRVENTEDKGEAEEREIQVLKSRRPERDGE